MADAKITDLTEQLDIQNEDLLVIIDDSEIPKTTKKIKASTLLDKTFLGIEQVDNTSDIDKPISTAQQAALDLKYNAADFDNGVTNNPAVLLNTAKITNANHTGEVTGDAALVLDKSAITNKPLVLPESGDMLLISDASDLDNLKKVDLANFVPPIFGTYFQSIEAELEVSTASEVYLPINELTLITPALPLGTYYVGWSMELGDGAAEYIIKDNLLVLAESDRAIVPQYRFKELSDNFAILNNISGVHSISMNYRTETGGAQLTFARRRRLIFYRLA